MSEDEVKPILKTNKNTSKKDVNVVWDEENLKYNDEHRTATMTIDEPPTPYNRDEIQISDDEEEQDKEQHQAPNPQSIEDKNDLMNQLTSKLQESTQPKFQKIEEENQKLQQESEEFKKKRSQHYNEFEALKQWRKKHSDDEQEEEEEEDED